VRARLEVYLVRVSALVVLFFLVCAFFPVIVAPYRATDMLSDAILVAPNWRHLCGTDQFGRDVFSLIVYGARQSLLVTFCATVVASAAGAFLGLLSGYAGGWVDMVVMRIIDMWMAIPSILLAIAVCTALGPSLPTLVLAVGVALIPRYARVLRAQALAVRVRSYIEAARVSGASHAAILRRHVLPQCLGPILVLATLGAGWSILIGSGLSFLGFGVNEERPDWGYLVSEGRSYLTVAWWTVTCPGLAIAALVVSVNLLGDALRGALAPRSSGT
jgi:peptide/nickel transport system permease protein